MTSNGYNIILIRHGESLNNIIYDELRSRLGADVSDEVLDIEESKLRSPDPGLSDKGVLQARHLGEFICSNGCVLGGIPFSTPTSGEDSWEIYSSPMIRALLTSQEIIKPLLAKHSDIVVKVKHDLYESGGCHERGRGLNGSSSSDVESRFLNFKCEPGMEQGWYHNKPKQETHAEFIDRMDRIAGWLFALQRNVILVMHGNLMSGIINRLIQGSTGNAPGDGCLFIHHNTAYTHVQVFTEPLPAGRVARISTIQGVNLSDHLVGHKHLLSGNRPHGDHWIQEFTPLIDARDG